MPFTGTKQGQGIRPGLGYGLESKACKCGQRESQMLASPTSPKRFNPEELDARPLYSPSLLPQMSRLSLKSPEPAFLDVSRPDGACGKYCKYLAPEEEREMIFQCFLSNMDKSVQQSNLSISSLAQKPNGAVQQ